MLALDEFLRRSGPRHCLAADSTCAGPICNAHSIQNAAILKSLGRNGKVYMPSLEGEAAGFELTGRHRASTFTGFCAYHDQALFNEIDYKDPNDLPFGDRRHAIVHRLRAISLELWKATLATIHLRAIHSMDEGFQRVLGEFGLTAKDVALSGHPVLMLSESAQKKKMSESKTDFEIARSALASGKYHHIIDHWIQMPIPVRFAVTSGFTPYRDFDSMMLYSLEQVIDRWLRMPHASVTVVPRDKDSVCIFTYSKKDASLLGPMFSSLQKMVAPQRQIAITKLVLNNCENVAFSPDYIDGLSDEKRSLILRAWFDSIDQEIAYSQMPDVSIFE